MIWRLKNRPTAIGAFRNASDASKLTIELNRLFDKLIMLDLPVPDLSPLSDQRQRMFMVPYLAAVEVLAGEGQLEKARLRAIGELGWESVAGRESGADA